MLKKIGLVFLGVAAVGVTAVAGLVLINLSDEPLVPAAKAVLEGSDIPLAGARNAYVMSYGLLAPEGADVAAAIVMPTGAEFRY